MSTQEYWNSIVNEQVPAEFRVEDQWSSSSSSLSGESGSEAGGVLQYDSSGTSIRPYQLPKNKKRNQNSPSRPPSAATEMQEKLDAVGENNAADILDSAHCEKPSGIEEASKNKGDEELPSSHFEKPAEEAERAELVEIEEASCASDLSTICYSVAPVNISNAEAKEGVNETGYIYGEEPALSNEEAASVHELTNSFQQADTVAYGSLPSSPSAFQILKESSLRSSCVDEIEAKVDDPSDMEIINDTSNTRTGEKKSSKRPIASSTEEKSSEGRPKKKLKADHVDMSKYSGMPLCY